MKKIVFALLLASTVAFGQQNKKTDLQKAGLQGKVKSYRMIGYEFDENGKEQLMNSEFYAEFDKKGMNTKMQAKNGGTVINYVDVYESRKCLRWSRPPNRGKRVFSRIMRQQNRIHI